MPDPLILRDATGDEVAGVAALLESSYTEHREHFPTAMWDAYRTELRAVADRMATGQLIVAVRGAGLVGTVTFYREASSDGHAWPPGFASLRLLAVHRSARGSGTGQALVHECVSRARRAGASHLGLHTAPFMEAANRLYADLGFVRCPPLDFDAEVHYGGVAPGSATGRIAGQAFVLAVAAEKAAR